MDSFKKNITFTVLMSVVIINACKEDAMENPCAKVTTPSADFIFESSSGKVVNNEYLFYYNPNEPKDTVTMGGKLQFRSEYTDTSIYKHTWYIGSEVLHNYKEWKDFSLVFRPTYITISHAMSWTPNKLCNPKDDGYDSIGFTFKLTKYYDDCAAFGKFRVVYDSIGANLLDSFDIQFYRSPNNQSQADSIIPNPFLGQNGSFRVKGFYVKQSTGNIVKSNYVPIDMPLVINNSFMCFELEHWCCAAIAETKVYINKHVAEMIYYNYTKKYTLRGRKLN